MFSRISFSLKMVLLTIALTLSASLFPSDVYFFHHGASGNIILLYSVFRSLVWMLLIPLLYVIYILKERPDTFGFTLPHPAAYAIKLTVLSSLLLLPLAVLLGLRPEFQYAYSLRDATIVQFFFQYVFLACIYYVAESFLFFGFLFHNLWNRLHYHSFWITGATFALMHIMKPRLEIATAFFTGLLFCYLSRKTKSILPVAIVHFILALTVNVLVTFVW